MANATLRDALTDVAARALTSEQTTIASAIYVLIEAWDYNQESALMEMINLYNKDVLKPLREDAPESEREDWRVAA